MVDLSHMIPDMKARNMTKQATTKDIENLLNEDYKETMNTIKWKDKTIKLPFKDADYSNPFEMETVSNPFSGESIAMPRFAVAVYDVTMGSNLIAEQYDTKHGTGTSPTWDDVRKGLDWFRQYFAKEYMVLLD